MPIAATQSKQQIDYYFKTVCKEKKEDFKEELKKTSMSNLKKVGKLFNIRPQSNKKDLIKQILIEFNKEKEMTEEANVAIEETPVGGPKEFVPIVDESLKGVIPRPESEDYELLKHSIQSKGLKKKISVLPDGRIIDGFTRYQILTELGITTTEDMFEVEDLSEKDLLGFQLMCNLERRQLNPASRIRLVKEYFGKEIREKISELSKEKRKLTKEGKKDKEEKSSGTREEIAKIAKTSTAAVKDQDFLEKHAIHLLRKAEETGDSLSALAAKVREMKKFLLKNMKKGDFDSLLKDILNGNKKIDEEFNRVSEEIKNLPKEQGPMEKLCIWHAEILTKEQARFHDALDSWIEKNSIPQKGVKSLKKICANPFDTTVKAFEKKRESMANRDK
jgi:hypothetical protein